MGSETPRVAILGAGFPAQIVGRGLADIGFSVDIFGDPAQALVTTSFGPHHLWAERLQGRDDFARAWPKVSACWQATVHVCFVDRDTLVHTDVEGVDVERHYRGYWAKVNGKATGSPPCQGRTHFAAFIGGFEALSADLLASKAKVRRHLVSSIFESRGRYFVAHGGESKPDGPYDLLVNTLKPSQFVMLATRRGAPLWYGPPPFPTEIHYAIGTRPPTADAGDIDPTDATTQLLVYNGSPEDPWHRCSTTKEGWCYEFVSRPTQAVLRSLGSEVSVGIPTRLNDCLTPFHYADRILPVGRFAEWNQELMVDDIMVNVDRYVKEALSAV